MLTVAPADLAALRDGMLGIRLALLMALAAGQPSVSDADLRAAIEQTASEIERRGSPEDSKIGLRLMFGPKSQ